MADVMDRLFAEWHRLGAPVLLAEMPAAVPERPPEVLIAECTAHCRDSGRLTWIVLAWLIDHADEIDAAALLAATRDIGDLSVLGVLCDAAHHRRPHAVFESVMAACCPNPHLEPFFTRVGRSPLATRIARENPVDVFLRWNYLCSELQYLDAGSRQAS
jgi:hypothetical protein